MTDVRVRDGDLSPAEQRELRRRHQISRSLEQVPPSMLSNKVLWALLIFLNLGKQVSAFEREQAFRVAEKEIKALVRASHMQAS